MKARAGAFGPEAPACFVFNVFYGDFSVIFAFRHISPISDGRLCYSKTKRRRRRRGKGYKEMDGLTVRTETDAGGRRIAPGKAFSPGFAREIGRQLLGKLQQKLCGEAAEQCDRLFLAGEDPSSFRRYKNGICSLPFRICEKESGKPLAVCNVIWKCGDGKKILCPWDEPGAEGVCVGMLIDREGVAEIRRALQSAEAQAWKKALPFSFRYDRGGRMAEVRIRISGQVDAASIAGVREALSSLACGGSGYALPAWPSEYSRREITAPLRLPGRPGEERQVAQTLAGLAFPIEQVLILPLSVRRQLALIGRGE